MSTHFETSVTDWLQYAANVQHSTERARRERIYNEALSLLEEGDALVAACKVLSSPQPMYIFINDFAAFNWVMDNLHDQWDELVGIRLQPAKFTVI